MSACPGQGLGRARQARGAALQQGSRTEEGRGAAWRATGRGETASLLPTLLQEACVRLGPGGRGTGEGRNDPVAREELLGEQRWAGQRQGASCSWFAQDGPSSGLVS